MKMKISQSEWYEAIHEPSELCKQQIASGNSLAARSFAEEAAFYAL